MFILLRKLRRTEDFFENNLENHVNYKEKFNSFFFIGTITPYYIMLKYENIKGECVMIEDDLIFFSSAVDEFTHS